MTTTQSATTTPPQAAPSPRANGTKRRSVPADFVLDVVFTLLPIIILVIFRIVERRGHDLLFATDFSYATIVFFGLSIARAQRLRSSTRQDEQDEKEKIVWRQSTLIVLLCVSLVFLFFTFMRDTQGSSHSPASAPNPEKSTPGLVPTEGPGLIVFAVIQLTLLATSVVFVWSDYKFRQMVDESKYLRSGQDGMSFCNYGIDALGSARRQLAFTAGHLNQVANVPELNAVPSDERRKQLVLDAIGGLSREVSSTADMKEHIKKIEDAAQALANVKLKFS